MVSLKKGSPSEPARPRARPAKHHGGDATAHADTNIKQKIPMFRDRPLTWLFVIATICVDLALMVARNNSWEYGLFVIGYVLGQVAALTIWAIRGDSIHRLLRFSCLVFAIRVFVSFVNPKPGYLLFIFFYTVLILAFTLLVEVVRYPPRNGIKGSKQRKRWQIPLIEFFGWTIIVAVVSLGSRQLEFMRVFQDTSSWLSLLSMVSLPILLAVFTRNDLRSTTAKMALVIITVAIAVGWYSKSYSAFPIIAVQAAYLGAWMTVLTLDNISVEAAKTISSPEEPSQATNKPKLFNPQN